SFSTSPLTVTVRMSDRKRAAPLPIRRPPIARPARTQSPRRIAPRPLPFDEPIAIGSSTAKVPELYRECGAPGRPQTWKIRGARMCVSLISLPDVAVQEFEDVGPPEVRRAVDDSVSRHRRRTDRRIDLQRAGEAEALALRIHHLSGLRRKVVRGEKHQHG